MITTECVIEIISNPGDLRFSIYGFGCGENYNLEVCRGPAYGFRQILVEDLCVQADEAGTSYKRAVQNVAITLNLLRERFIRDLVDQRSRVARTFNTGNAGVRVPGILSTQDIDQICNDLLEGRAVDTSHLRPHLFDEENPRYKVQ